MAGRKNDGRHFQVVRRARVFVAHAPDGGERLADRLRVVRLPIANSPEVLDVNDRFTPRAVVDLGGHGDRCKSRPGQQQEDRDMAKGSGHHPVPFLDRVSRQNQFIKLAHLQTIESWQRLIGIQSWDFQPSNSTVRRSHFATLLATERCVEVNKTSASVGSLRSIETKQWMTWKYYQTNNTGGPVAR